MRIFLKLNSIKETIQRRIIEAEAQINELQQKVDTFPLAEGLINELKQKIDSLTKQKGKGKQEKKMIYTNGKKERIPIKNKPQKEKKKEKNLETQVRQTKLEVYEIHKFLVYFKTASTPLQ